MSSLLPPKLQPEQSSSSMSSAVDTSTSSVAVSDVLLRILSKLTVYQSLPEISGSPVLAVLETMPLAAALALLLPSKEATGPSFSHKVIEVMGEWTPNPPVLLAKSKQLIGENELLSKALQAEAFKACYPTSVAGFLSVRDLLYFVLRKPSSSTVREWIRFKEAQAARDYPAGVSGEIEWIRFCQESTLILRSSLSMSPAVELRKNSILSSSTMNMTVSTLLKQSTSMGDLIAPGSHSLYWKTQLRTARMGGSSLVAVRDLLARPWQTSLPLTVQTENGIEAIFAYTTLAQLMAHVSMNCSDKLLEPFFSMDVSYDAFAAVATEHLERCPLLHFTVATAADAVEVLASSPFALLAARSNGTLRATVTQDDILQILAERMNSSSELVALDSLRLSSHATPTSVGVMSVSDFPCPFSLILQNILQSRMSALVVVSREEAVPIGIITVKDVWDYVMQGASVLRD